MAYYGMRRNSCYRMVSVIIATYRRDVSLKRAIESVLNQTYCNIEIIVVDDNDNPQWNEKVQAVINQFASNRIRYIQNPEHMGSGATRNRGIECAKGQYVSFLDDDDYYLPEKIEHQMEDFVCCLKTSF